jgi:hypothetical protein
LDVFGSIEEALRQIAPILLAGPGIVLVLTGLFLWLGGLRWLKPLAAFSAAGAGLVCAWLFTDRTLVPLAGCTVIFAVAALFLEKPVVVLLGAVLAAGVVLALPFFIDGGVQSSMDQRMEAVPSVHEMTLFESVEFLEKMAAWAAEWTRIYWDVLPAERKMAAAGILAGVVLAGGFAWRWICAITCSVLGTGMILLGMTFLLFSKGPDALPYIKEKIPYLWLGAAIMAASGTLLNRWLNPVKVKDKTKHEAHSSKGDRK